jgi:hypothetical protein
MHIDVRSAHPVLFDGMRATVMTNYREWRTADKARWTPGAWHSEPDKAQWIDEATGLDCLIVRNHSGSLCGYVGVTEGHPLFAMPYNDYENMADFDVHGGLTFSGFCSPSNDESKGICHVPAPGRPDHVWWLGFDCGHNGDIAPGFDAHIREIMPFEKSSFSEPTDVYRTFTYVVDQVQGLARQLVK